MGKYVEETNDTQFMPGDYLQMIGYSNFHSIFALLPLGRINLSDAQKLKQRFKYLVKKKHQIVYLNPACKVV